MMIEYDDELMNVMVCGLWSDVSLSVDDDG